jgi:hypothetical protein
MAVGIAQLAEHRTVAPTVAGSIPVSHPRNSPLRSMQGLRINQSEARIPPDFRAIFDPLWQLYWLIDTQAGPFRVTDKPQDRELLAELWLEVPGLKPISPGLCRPGILRDFELDVDEWTYLVGLRGPEADAIDLAVQLRQAGWPQLSAHFFELVERNTAVFLMWVDGWWEIYASDAGVKERLKQLDHAIPIDSTTWQERAG